ncbi:MAG: ion transporter [Methanosarcinales archaeon]|nr:ion transporter [Methanosarcinales archaeon]
MSRPENSQVSQPERSFRESVHFYMIDHRTPLGRGIDFLIISLNLLICAIFVANTYTISDQAREVLWRIEVSVVFFFIVEYVLRLYGSYDRRSHVRHIYSIIDLVAIFPTILEIIMPFFGLSLHIGVLKTIRVFAVFRIFRFLRFFAVDHMFFGVIATDLLKVMRLTLTILIIFFISSGLFYYVESPANPMVRNFGDAFYFTVVALSTVGFGDIVPVSEAGRWVTVLMIISGIILIPWQASQIVREWLTISAKKSVICPDCGLNRHDMDASHCKQCGHVLYRKNG